MSRRAIGRSQALRREAFEIADSASSVNRGFAMNKRRIMTTSGGLVPIMMWAYAKALLLVGRDAVPGAKVGAIRAGDLIRHPDGAGQAGGDHAARGPIRTTLNA